MKKQICLCSYRASTQGCTEWSCMYHGQENERKSKEVRATCPIHERLDFTASPNQGRNK